jgi:hypothetical protein
MLRTQTLCRVDVLRWSPATTVDPMPPWDLACDVVWRDGSTEVWIEAMRGKLRPQYLRDWADWLRANGITKVYAHRVVGHRLPLFEDAGDHLELRQVERFVGRFGSHQASGSEKPSALISIVSGNTPSC